MKSIKKFVFYVAFCVTAIVSPFPIQTIAIVCVKDIYQLSMESFVWREKWRRKFWLSKNKNKKGFHINKGMSFFLYSYQWNNTKSAFILTFPGSCLRKQHTHIFHIQRRIKKKSNVWAERFICLFFHLQTNQIKQKDGNCFANTNFLKRFVLNTFWTKTAEKKTNKKTVKSKKKTKSCNFFDCDQPFFLWVFVRRSVW